MANSKPPTLHRSCGTMASHMMLLEKYPAFRARQFQLEQESTRARTRGLDVAALKLVTINVVVNVVHDSPSRTSPTRRSRARSRCSTTTSARRIPTSTKMPRPWKGLVTDSRIRFKLFKVRSARRRRRRLQLRRRGQESRDGRHRAALSPQKYLNLWVCALGGGLLGYAQFPGRSASTDGVVINYPAFGTTGHGAGAVQQGTHGDARGRPLPQPAPHLGRHRRIAAAPTSSPTRRTAPDRTSASRSSRESRCNNGPNGDMFVNYMDYTDDAGDVHVHRRSRCCACARR